MLPRAQRDPGQAGMVVVSLLCALRQEFAKQKKHTVPGSGARARLEKVTGAHCDTGMEQGLMFPHSVGLKLCSAACFVQNAHLSSALQDTLMMLCV